MPLTTAELLMIREECLADDVEVPAEAVSWVASEAREFFESGGTKIPRYEGLEGAETHAYFERARDEQMNSAATMLEALKMTIDGTPPAPAADGLRAGARVQSHGLVKKPELNWLVGTVAKQRKDGRWAVEFDDGRQIALRPDNLKLIAAENLEAGAARYVAAPQEPGSSEKVPIPTPNFVD
jgi:hypothetical protein